MSWILSGTSVLMLVLMGNKSRLGPAVGIVNQILWFYYAVSIREYGLLLGVFAFLIVHIRNYIKWSNE